MASNLLSTPENYATPAQIEAMNAYGKALLGDSQKPIKHWTQGISNIVSALVGGNQQFLANNKQNESDAVRAGRMMPDTSGAAAPTEPPLKPRSFSEGTAPVAQKTADASQPRGYRNNNPLNIEAGSFTKSQPGFTGSDGRFAKFDTMESGVKAADNLLNSYEKRGLNTVNGIISRWAPASDGNNVNAYAVNVAKRLGVSPDAPLAPEQRQQLIAAMAQHENGKPMPTMALNGPDAGPPPAVTAMTAALRGGDTAAPVQVAEAQMAKGGPPALTGAPRQQRPDPEASKIYINPALVPKRPQMNPGQVRGILADPTISESAKLQLRQEYMQQNQPIEVPVTGGRVLINPLNPTQQQFIPELKWGKSKIGDIETDSGYTTDGRGNIIQAPIQRPGITNGPRSEAAPGGPVAPAVAPQGTPAVAPALGSAVASAAPAAPVAAPEAVPNTGGVQVASLDPAAGVAEAAKVAEPAAPDNPLAKWAQATPPGVAMPAGTAANGSLNLNSVDPVLAEDYARKKAFDNKAEVDKDAQVKGTEMAMKKYDNMSTQAQSARKLMPNLDLATSLMEDPNFSSGLLHGVKDTWQRLKDATGIAQMSNAPNEAFDKLMAGTVLDTMKSVLAGLGQVRLAEIELLNKANGNRNNSVASNRAVLEISKRAVQKVDQLDSIAQQYVSGDEVLNPLTGQVMLKANIDRNGEMAPRRGLDAGFDKLARKFTLEHPSFKPDEIKNYNTLFTAPAEKAAAPAAAPAETGAPAVGTIKEFSDGKGGTVKGQWDGKAWGPAK